MTEKEIITNGQLYVESIIKESFEGFGDEMLFALTNGQYWLQTEAKYWYHYAYMPEVKIYLYNGFHYLVVDGQNETARVLLLTDVVEAIVVNDFNGWYGDTLFGLDNGDIWKQNEYAYRFLSTYKPRAIVYAVRGSYRIRIEGETVGVEKLK